MSRSSKAANQWSNLLDQWRSSGLNARAWCTQRNIGYQSFLNWRKKLKVPLLKDHFIELSDSETLGSGIELEFQGITIKLQKSFDGKTLQRCLSLLRDS